MLRRNGLRLRVFERAMPLLTCPGCGHCGDGGRSEAEFDYLGRDGLVELRRCRACGAGLLVRFTLLPAHAHAEVVAPEVWREIGRGGRFGTALKR